MNQLITGQKFGRWTVIRAAITPNRAGYLCRCECGNESKIATSQLKSGKSKSCGCSMRALSDRQVAEIIKLYNNGAPAAVLSKRFYVSVWTIINALKKSGIHVMGRAERQRSKACGHIGKSDMDKILSEHLAGARIFSLAAKYRVGHKTLKKVIAEAGIKPKMRHKKPDRIFSPEEEKAICERYIKGEFASEVARSYAVHNEHIFRVLSKHGIKKRAKSDVYAGSRFRKMRSVEAIRQIQGGLLGKTNTLPERSVARMLDEIGTEYVQQYAVRNHACFDFFVKPFNTLIEVHGDFWHANPKTQAKRPLYSSQKRNIGNDKRKAVLAQKAGHRLIVLWECDIKNGTINAEKLQNLLLRGEDKTEYKNKELTQCIERKKVTNADPVVTNQTSDPN